MSIQWFPGHMTKAKRQMSEALKSADMVIEILDARIPFASQNPLLDELCANKPRLVILSKADKADEKQTKKYLELLNQKYPTISLDIQKDNFKSLIVSSCLKAMKEKHDKQKARGINPRAIRTMVVGIPNVGKSTFINKLSKKRVVKVEDTPGVTRSITVISVDKNLQLLDTPGVLWPKFEDQKVGFLLATIGSINDDILNKEEIAIFALDILLKHYPNNLIDRYNIEITNNLYELLERIGKSRNDLNNGIWDKNRTINAFINDLRNDKLGRITWEYYE